MNQRRRTIVIVLLAAAAALVTWIARPAPTVDARFADMGQPLVPALTDPGQVAQIEVIAYDAERARHTALLLRFAGGRWIIPSAYDYPADATGRIAEAAAMLVGLKREAVVSERRIDHANLGLIDPTDESGDPEGRGVKLTITGAEGDTLADVIIGGAFEGVQRERFVRLAGSDRAYRTTFHAAPGAALSTALVDWINADLLRLGADDIASITVDTATVDESLGARVEGETYAIARNLSAGSWVARDGSAVNDDRADQLTRDLASLRLVGVEPMPGKLSALLTGASADAALDQVDLINLQRAGFFLSPRGGLVANAGNAIIETADGLTITLWFGELTETPADSGALFGADDPESEAGPSESRYVLVTVRPTDPADPDASQAAQSRARRLADWWYLIEEPAFQAIRPARSAIFSSADQAEQPAP